MLETLIDDITGTQDDPSLRAIVIASEGPVFSAGHDLKELVSHVDYVYSCISTYIYFLTPWSKIKLVWERASLASQDFN
jgi:enoyl-CoA hydratase/carnithine racemase